MGLVRKLEDMSATRGTPFVSGSEGNSTPGICVFYFTISFFDAFIMSSCLLDIDVSVYFRSHCALRLRCCIGANKALAKSLREKHIYRRPFRCRRSIRRKRRHSASTRSWAADPRIFCSRPKPDSLCRTAPPLSPPIATSYLKK
jgi:hypothetical protein